MALRERWAGGSAVAAQPTNERAATAGKFAARYKHRPGPEYHPLGYIDHEFTQQVGFRTRIVRHVHAGLLKDSRIALAHEHPELAHHGAPHADRLEYSLQSLILNITNDMQKEVLEKYPVILGGTFLFPRGHDFFHQVLTGQRKLDDPDTDPKAQLNAKRAHDLAGGLVMLGQVREYEQALNEAYEPLPEITGKDIKKEAMIMGIIGLVISAPHGDPGAYEDIISKKGPGSRAYTEEFDPSTGITRKVPRAYSTEEDAESLLMDYRAGKIDPFSLTIAQYMAMMTYEVSHPNPKNKVINRDMRTYDYGVYPDGLHPAMQERYGDTLFELALEYTQPLEDILPAEIYQERSTIEHMGKLALLADTIDLVADPEGSVVRSLLTQKTFTGENPRPIWAHGLTEADIPAMLEYVAGKSGEDWKPEAHTTPGFGLGRRLSWEKLNWWPFKGVYHSDLQQLIGDITVMAHFAQTKIIDAWMSPKRNDWNNVLDSLYKERIASYKAKAGKRAPGTVIDSSWLKDERKDVLDLLGMLQEKTGTYTEEERQVFRTFSKEALAKIKEKYGISDEHIDELKAVNDSEQKYRSKFIKPDYDVPLSTGVPPLRGLVTNAV